MARLRCPKAGVTISLLPDFLAARMTGTLHEVEQVVATAEQAESREAAAGQLRPADEAEAVTLPSALRWLRRRLVPVRAALLTAVTLLPELTCCAPTVAALRERLGVMEVLMALRARTTGELPALCAPVGLCARARRPTRARQPAPHDVGPDPPGGGR